MIIRTLQDLAGHFGAAPTLSALNARLKAENRHDVQIALRGEDASWLEHGFDDVIPAGFQLVSFDLQYIVEGEIAYDRTLAVPLSKGELERQVADFITRVGYLETAAGEDLEEVTSEWGRLTREQWDILLMLLHHVAMKVAKRAREMLREGLPAETDRRRILVFQESELESMFRSAHAELGTPREFLEPDLNRLFTHYTLRLQDAGFVSTDALEHSRFTRLRF